MVTETVQKVWASRASRIEDNNKSGWQRRGVLAWPSKEGAFYAGSVQMWLQVAWFQNSTSVEQGVAGNGDVAVCCGGDGHHFVVRSFDSDNS